MIYPSHQRLADHMKMKQFFPENSLPNNNLNNSNESIGGLSRDIDPERGSTSMSANGDHNLIHQNPRFHYLMHAKYLNLARAVRTQFNSELYSFQACIKFFVFVLYIYSDT